jgi:hypothetical protein
MKTPEQTLIPVYAEVFAMVLFVRRLNPGEEV